MWARKIFTGEPWKKEYFKIVGWKITFWFVFFFLILFFLLLLLLLLLLFVDYIKDFYFNFCERKDRSNGLNINVTCWKYLKCYATQMARWDAKIPIFSVTSLVSGHKCARNLPKIKLVYLELGRSSLICSDFRWLRTSLLVLKKIYTHVFLRKNSKSRCSQMTNSLFEKLKNTYSYKPSLKVVCLMAFIVITNRGRFCYYKSG